MLYHMSEFTLKGVSIVIMHNMISHGFDIDVIIKDWEINSNNHTDKGLCDYIKSKYSFAYAIPKTGNEKTFKYFGKFK